MRIGQVADEADVSVDTIRFYERRGVLPVAARTDGGYRIYTDATVRRIRMAKGLQRLGFTLDEVIDALHATDAGDAECATERWRMQRALARIDAQIAELRQVRREVVATMDDCDRGDCAFRVDAVAP